MNLINGFIQTTHDEFESSEITENFAEKKILDLIKGSLIRITNSLRLVQVKFSKFF